MSSKGDDSQAIGDDFEAIIFGDYIEKYLKEGILTGVYLKDERFGNLDDIVFELNSNILHCIQAKGSKSMEEFTIGNLLNIKKGKKFSLFQNLYNSFQILKKNFKGFHLKLELITNRFPSSSTRSLPKDGNKKISFSSFFREIWRPYKSNQITKEMILEDSINQQFIDKFSNHLNISNDELWEFLEHFNFNFAYLPSRARSIEELKNIEIFYNWFLLTKKNPEKKGYFSKDVLLKEFGLSVSPNPHDFPVEMEKYIPFPNLKDEIVEEISKLNKGYLFLQGGPSTGKSTFLESEINNKTIRECIIFKYLCFREPNELGFRSRGELVHFFEDLNEQFKIYIKGTSIQNIHLKFTENLHKLSELAEEKNKKILIIIDGIDHITREELDKLDKPLTNYLPKPSTLPERIIFIVGGQHFRSIPWYQFLNESKECKTYHLPAFTENEIESYIKKYFKYEKSLDYDILEVLLKKTQGNPRYLKLIIENFESYDDLSKDHQIIDEYLDFDNNWDNLYQKYWIFFGFDNDLGYKKIAGMISRIHGPIDLMWLYSWPERIQIENFVSKFKFLFKKYSNILLFEHNSFKTFLQRKSVIFADISMDFKEEDLYVDLASRCNGNNTDSYAFWDKIIYLRKAKKIKDCGINREYFLSQWLQGRNLGDIIEDIGILLEYYMNNKDIETTFKIIFLKLEFEVRKAINELDTNSNYIFLINPVFTSSEHHLLYLCANVLHSIEVSPLFKLNFILFLIDREILKEDTNVFLLIKGYFRSNRQNWIEVSHNPEYDEAFTNKWLKVAYFFEKDSNIVITDYNKFLSAKHKNYILEGERWRYYPVLLAMGEFLIENSLIESLNIIYDILNELIEEDEWELIDKENVIFKNKFRPEMHTRDKENPFYIILGLKYKESNIRGVNYFKNFLNESNLYKIIFNESDLNKVFKFRNSNDLSEENILSLIGWGFSVDHFYGYGKAEVKNRIVLYQYLHDIFEYDKEKIFAFFKERLKESNLKIKDEIARDSIKMQWEYSFFNLAINLDRPYTDLEQAEPLLRAILNLFEMFGKRSNFIDEQRIRIFAGLSFILSILMKKIEGYSFLYDWFQETIFYFIKEKKYMFNDIRTQIWLIINIQNQFKKINLDLVKWVINNAREHYSIHNIGYWNLSSIIYNILEALETLKYEHIDYYKDNRKFFIEKLSIFGFRLYPRKDWQLYYLIHILEKVIHYFPQNNVVFIDNIRLICNMLYMADEITERSEIFNVSKLFHDAILTWNEDLARETYFLLSLNSYKPREFISNKKIEEIKIEKQLTDELTNLIEDPPKFLICIGSYLSEIREKNFSQEQIEYSVDILKILTELDEFEQVTFESWRNLFEYLIKQGEDKSILETFNSSFIIYFIEFYKGKLKSKRLDETEIKDLEIKIEKSFLKSPKDEFSFSSIEKLYALDKEECFKYGWEVINNQFNIRRKKIISYIPHDFTMYTFISIINETNFKYYWKIYFRYLKNLFKFMNFL